MKKLFAFLFAAVCAAVPAGNITVVLPEKPTPVESRAAEELRELLKKTSRVSVVRGGTSDPGKIIYLGGTEEARKLSGGGKFDAEEWLIRALDGRRLVLAGGRRGVLYAVYEFLERLGGVMFLDQYTVHGPEKEPAWTPALSLSGKPSFPWRSLYSFFAGGKSRYVGNIRQRQNFFLNEKLTPLLKSFGLTPVFGRPRGNHTYYFYSREWKNAPDEYFSLSPRTGRRERATGPSGPGQICYSHPEVRRLFAEQLKKFIEMDRKELRDVPPPVYYVMTANDNDYPCACEKCRENVKKFGGYTGLALDFVNELARSIAEEYPDVKLKFSAYLFTQTPPPPGTRIEKNVILQPAQMGTEWSGGIIARTSRENLRPLTHPRNAGACREFLKWAAFGRLSVYDYWIAYGDRGHLTDACDAVAENFKVYRDRADIVFGEIEEPVKTSFHALRMYLILRLANNVSLDAASEIERFMTAYYGPAAPEMKALRQLILDENRSEPGDLARPLARRRGLTDAYFAKAETLLARALGKAGKDNALALRIRRERLNFDRVRLMLPRFPGGEDLRKATAERFLADFDAVSPLYLTGKSLRKEREEALRTAQGSVFSVGGMKEFPGRKVVGCYRGNAFPAQYQAKIGRDPDSFAGTALYRAADEPASAGIVFGYCDRIGKKSVAKRLKPGEFKFDGKYHWYRIGVVKLSADCYAFAHRSWEMQRRLMDLVGGAPGDRVELYIRLKAEPDPAAPEKIARLWMDGVAALEPLSAAAQNGGK
ncbi:MAG: DUF4838 domain-containing protein [Lentisphaeria bacterium]|nr:DUF4838 domain-containing protein [Lentisphaeria bacterium]